VVFHASVQVSRFVTFTIPTTDDLCTIETPEGPNIGLISSLCVYAKINNLGFIETPYRVIENGKVDLNRPPVFLTAEEEDNKVIAQANAHIDAAGNFLDSRVKARYEGDFPEVDPEESAPD
jgi:DNA-directed RNA polymerase subunit beta